MQKLEIAIILTTRNRINLVEQALRSIKEQTFENFECWVIDDNSTDGTAELVTNFCERDKRFNYFKKPENYVPGLSDSRNFGLDIAKGSFVVFCDDDDVMHPQHLETCLYYFNDTTDFVHFKKQFFVKEVPDFKEISTHKSNPKELNKKHIADVISQKIALASCTVMWKRKAIGKQRFHPGLDYAEEWEFYTRLILNEAKGLQIDDILYFNLKHPHSNTGEFYAGNSKRMASQIEASKMVIENLNEKNLLNAELVHFFTWECVRFKSRELLRHLINQSSLTVFQKLKAVMQYEFGPLTQILMRLKKRLKMNVYIILNRSTKTN